jgi:hypothetical protein
VKTGHQHRDNADHYSRPVLGRSKPRFAVVLLLDGFYVNFRNRIVNNLLRHTVCPLFPDMSIVPAGSEVRLQKARKVQLDGPTAK